MTAPNRNTLWAQVIADELAAAGIDAVCIAPGSRSTPLAVAFAEHDDVRTLSHLDERSAAYFALGRAKCSGTPTPVVTTSGTAAANLHPAVIEASNARVPMILLTADRPRDLWDSGANQTVDQVDLYGDAVRWARSLEEPRVDARSLRSLRTSIGRAVAASTGSPAGPVHLNCPFRKPLEPIDVPGDVPDSFATEHSRAAEGRAGAYLRTTVGTPRLDDDELDQVLDAIRNADRGLIVTGPTDRPAPSREALAALAMATGFPVLADPLSGHRFGPHVGDVTICGGYDAYLDREAAIDWPAPDCVLRFGASPTSKTLREYLADVDPRQFLVDPAGGWREATFTATDLLQADPTWLAETIAKHVSRTAGEYADRMQQLEQAYWQFLEKEELPVEGDVLASVVDCLPPGTTLFVSNSTPVRDLDRFAAPRTADLQVLGNRGASGIDGITSTALGARSASADPLVLVTGDLAFYHDMNGLLALDRCDVSATVVLINNDGGGIFHMLPIEDFEPFEAQFKTPHGLDFSPVGELYDLAFRRETAVEGVCTAVETAIASEGSHVIEFETDAESNHRRREALQREVTAALERAV